MATNTSDQLLFTRIGANDPEFNLRRDAAFMIRRKGARDTVFASVIESHGSYSPVSEFADNSNSNIAQLKVIHDDDNYTAVSIKDKDGNTSMLMLSNMDASASRNHNVTVGGTAYSWTGPYQYIESK